MIFALMITNGGPHPPEKWAGVTASQVIDIASSAPDALMREGRAFETKVQELLTGHHRLAQDHERAALVAEGAPRLFAGLDTAAHMFDAVDDIIVAARGTSFAAHFANPETRVYLERLVHEHMHHNMLVERSWYADAHPDHPHSKAFKAVQADGHAALSGDDKELAALGGPETLLAMVRNVTAGSPRKSEG